MHGDLKSHQKEQQKLDTILVLHYIFFYIPLTDLPINLISTISNTIFIIYSTRPCDNELWDRTLSILDNCLFGSGMCDY